MTFLNLCEKEIISIETGKKLGYADDVVFDRATATITKLVVFSKGKFLGLKGKDNIMIDWCDVVTFGDDTILIKGSYGEMKPEIAP